MALKLTTPIPTTSNDMEETEISPKMAERMLALNHSNRRLRSTVIVRYAHDMSSGKWRLKGQTPIMFDRQGNLVNGQHRLLACIQSGVSFPAYILRNVDPADVDVADTGLNRTLGDALSFRGAESPHKLAQVLRVAWLYENKLLSIHRFSDSPSRTEAVEFLERNPGLIDSMLATQDLVVKLRMPLGVVAAVHYYGSKRYPEKTEEFFNGLRHGTQLAEGSPILALRNRLTDRVFPSGTIRVVYMMALVNKAFNAFLQGKTLQQARWRMRGKNAEAFPYILGDE